MPKPRRVLGYARVSSAEQALGTSLRDQQESIRAYASTLGLAVAKFYVEAESAIREKVERREQLRSLLADAREGDLVVVDKLDRWSRDTEHTLRTVRELKARDAQFLSVAERCTSDDEGIFMLTMRAALAREEHTRIRARTVGTRKLLRDKGYYVEGTPPLGYARQGVKGVEKNILVIVPEEAELVRDIFDRYVRGQSMLTVAYEVGRPLHYIKRILERRTYVGEVKAAHGWIKGHHEAIVDARTFARATELRAQRRLGGSRPRMAPAETDTWILRDVARCMHCGSKMSAAYAGPKDARRYYYRCAHRCEAVAPQSNNGSYVPVAEVEEPFAAMVLERLAELRDELARGPKAQPFPSVDVTARRAKLASKRERYLEMYADGTTTRDELQSSLARLTAEGVKLDDLEAAQRPPASARKGWRREALRELGILAVAWERAAYAKLRRQIVNRLAVDVRIARDESPAPRWRPLEELIEDV